MGFRPRAERWQQLFPGGTTRVLVLGHRGFGKGRRPAENSAGAFDAALAAGADGIEADVILSGDGVPIVAHGPDGLAAGRPDLKLARTKMAELNQLDFAASVGGAPERMLTLEAFLDRYAGRTIVNVELKPWRILNGELERRVADLLRPRLARGDRIFVTSFNPFALRRIGRHLPELCIGMLWRDDLHWFARNRSLFAFVRPDFLQPFHERIDADLLGYAAEHGYRLHTWTINERSRFEELVAQGVPLIYTDEVAAAVRWAQEIGPGASDPGTTVRAGQGGSRPPPN